MDIVFVFVAGGVALLIGGAFYLGRKMPYPFQYEGRKYRRLSDGSFTDAAKVPVTDAALIPMLKAQYEKAKYGDNEKLSNWDISND